MIRFSGIIYKYLFTWTTAVNAASRKQTRVSTLDVGGERRGSDTINDKEKHFLSFNRLLGAKKSP